MNLTSPSIIKELLQKYSAKPNKRLGQNFLIDKNILDKIIQAASLSTADVVLEVGPGIGTLTQELAQKAGKVIAVEKDKTMVNVLGETLAEYKNVEIKNCDILEFIENLKFKIENYKVVANIPYYLTSPLIRLFLESNPPAGGQPEEIVLLVQKEVAQRICAEPGDMSLLAVSVQFYAQPEIVSYVSKNCFYPAPKIDSAIIKIIPNKTAPQVDADLFFKIVKAGFSQPRKQLAGNLSKGLKLDKEKILDWLKQNNLDPKQRAETLSVQDWQNLTETF